MKVNRLASTALPFEAQPGIVPQPRAAPAPAPAPTTAAPAAAVPVSGPVVTARTLDWPCCAAPSVLHGWNALALHASEPNPFHESWYLLPALGALDPQESVKFLLFEVGDVLVGMMPLAREQRYYGRRIANLAGWTHPNCFLGAPLVAPGFERAFWRALLEWADRKAGKALFLHLTGLPLHGPLHQALSDVVAETGRPAGVVFREERAMLAAGKSPEEYFTAALSGKKRKELRRQLARLSEEGEVNFVRQANGEDLDVWIDRFLELEAAGWKGEAGSALAQQGTTEALFRESLEGAAAHSRLERLSLTLDGRPIAMLANFITAPGAFSYKTTYDEAYSRFSPGVLLQCENLLMLDRADVQWTDSCAAEGHPMIDHIWRERRALGRISVGIGGKLRRGVFARLLKLELGRNLTGVTL
jgi:CelD/BcsL family acetyltransferase involved in cellulose biosynthesis